MSINKEKPHLLILPEDQAYTDLANGFKAHTAIKQRVIQVLHNARGWLKVVDCFKTDHVQYMEATPHRHMLLLIDCDNDPNRLNLILANEIPNKLRDRVFVLGANPEPEKLKSYVSNGYETIGRQLAEDCFNQTNTTWGHDILKHNQTELVRMRSKVNQFLFNQ